MKNIYAAELNKKIGIKFIGKCGTSKINKVIEAELYTKDGEKLIDLTEVTLKGTSEFLIIKMEINKLVIIKQIQEITHCPIWAIEKCLELEQNNINKILKRLIDIYFVIGDNPNEIIKQREKELKNTE